MIQTEDVSLSGSKFFFITRQMILMVGFSLISPRTAWYLLDSRCEGFLCCRRNTLSWATFKTRIVQRVWFLVEQSFRLLGWRSKTKHNYNVYCFPTALTRRIVFFVFADDRNRRNFRAGAPRPWKARRRGGQHSMPVLWKVEAALENQIQFKRAARDRPETIKGAELKRTVDSRSWY